MYMVVTGSKKAQVFLYLYGPAGSGKTMFANFLSAVIGRERVIYTSLKALNTDKFETYNLRFKNLINIPDAARYETDAPVLKQLTGNDPIEARAKYIQGTFKVKRVGNIMITSNHAFKSRDNTPAMLRRLIPFLTPQTHTKYKQGEPLIYPTPSGFEGPGVGELSGILN